MQEVYSDEAITKTIDIALKQMDKDNDGFISYSEFMSNNKATPPPKTK